MLNNVNYFKIMNLFWDVAPELAGYKSDHPALFHAILDSINRNGWRDTEIEYDRIINKVRLGKKNYLEGRAWLSENKFITFTPGKGKGEYARAKFGLGDAVLGSTASNTASGSSHGINAVLPNTASSTASDTGKVINEVLPSTASDTASSTAISTTTGTALNTLFINKQITNNIQQEQQQKQTPVPGAVDDGVDVESLFVEEVEEKKTTPPQPLPTTDEVRSNLLASDSHKRYAINQKKLAVNDEGYAELIDEFITQQEMQADPSKPLKPVFQEMYKVRRHFMNWLGDRYTRSQTSKSNGNNNSGKGAKGSLRSTALGSVNYRGTGSTCDVEL